MLGEKTTHQPTVYERFPQLEKLQRFPSHVLIIPDGNGRWAQKIEGVKALPIIGHRAGAKALRDIMMDLVDIKPIKKVTIWTMSPDNWEKRTTDEIAGITNLQVDFLTDKNNLKFFMDKNVRFTTIGREDRISEELREAIRSLKELTKNNTEKILNFAIDYGGKDQEFRIVKKALQLGIKAEDLTPAIIETLRDGYPLITPANYIIRTSGERRTSYLGWLEEGAELYFMPKLLPDTSTTDYIDALVDYDKRQIRLGGRQDLNGSH